ncbi:MAG: NUDIX domain-containing protein [Leptolyngbyaceae cyanobacterium]
MTDNWQICDRILKLQTPWLKLIGEKLLDTNGNLLDYWRVEKADSVIILPIYRQQMIFPRSSYRPGVGKVTLDFPGGRCPASQSPQEAAIAILQRELGIEETAVTHLMPLNTEGWAINSSFSNQLLHGFVAQLAPDYPLDPDSIEVAYDLTPEGMEELSDRLTCLQCRMVLREWQAQRSHCPHLA